MKGRVRPLSRDDEGKILHDRWDILLTDLRLSIEKYYCDRGVGE